MASFEKLNPTDLIKKSIKSPQITPENRSLTMNGMGYVFEIINPLSLDFLENEAKPGKSVCEIGTGFGPVPINALERGVSRYVACDLLEEHLALLAERFYKKFGDKTDELVQSLELIRAKAPTELPPFKKEFDAVLMDKVLHFMTPDEIEIQITWLKKALKKGGKVYILTITPHHGHFREKFLPAYLERRAEGFVYPGYIANMKKELGETPKHHPNEMTVFTLDDFSSLLESRGFKILKSFVLARGNENDPDWKIVDEKDAELIGVIAELNS